MRWLPHNQQNVVKSSPLETRSKYNPLHLGGREVFIWKKHLDSLEDICDHY